MGRRQKNWKNPEQLGICGNFPLVERWGGAGPNGFCWYSCLVSAEDRCWLRSVRGVQAYFHMVRLSCFGSVLMTRPSMNWRGRSEECRVGEERRALGWPGHFKKK